MSDSAELLAVFEKAAGGDRAAAEAFFRGFLQAIVFIPDRHQQVTVAPQVTYPNDLVSVLGVAEGDRVVVPIFMDRTFLEQWAGQMLNFKEVPGVRALELVPDEWWACINPGQEVEKELTPWEVSELRRGPDAVADVVAENFSDGPESVRLLSIDPGQRTELIDQLRRAALANSDIDAVFLMLEQRVISDRDSEETVLIGARVGQVTIDREKQIAAQIREVAERAQIGAEPVRVFVGGELRGSITLDLFRHSDPVYVKQGTAQQGTSRFFSKIRSILTR